MAVLIANPVAESPKFGFPREALRGLAALDLLTDEQWHGVLVSSRVA